MPELSTAIPRAVSALEPPRYVEYTSAVADVFTLDMKTSAEQDRVVPTVVQQSFPIWSGLAVGKSEDSVDPVT